VGRCGRDEPLLPLVVAAVGTYAPETPAGPLGASEATLISGPLNDASTPTAEPTVCASAVVAAGRSTSAAAKSWASSPGVI
jgi:hypothetical protein